MRDLSSDSNDRAIVSAIIRTGAGAGMQTLTAEGETEPGQLEFLHEQGCDEGGSLQHTTARRAAGALHAAAHAAH